MRPPRTTRARPTSEAGVDTTSDTTSDAPSPPSVRGRRAHAGPPADEGPTEPADEAPASSATRAWPRRIQPRTVRARIVCLLMVPVVSLLALWAYATVTTAQDISRLRQVQRVDARVRVPVSAAVAALQAERLAAVRHATDPSSVPGETFRELTARTDRAVGNLRLGDHHTVADSEELPAGVARRLEAFVSGAERLGPLRTAVLDHRADWEDAYRRYTAAISTAFHVGGALSGVQDADPGSDARVLVEFARAGEALAQEDVLLASARLADGLAGARLRLFTGAVDTRRTLTGAAVADLGGDEGAAWRNLADSDAYLAVGATEDRLLGSGARGKPVEATAPRSAWDEAHARVRDGMRAIERDAGRSVADRTDPFTRGALTPAGAAVLFGLLAVAASLVISVRIGRGLVVELVSLRDSALEIARHKLPEAMRRLRAGEEIDIRSEAPPRPPAEDEAGQVAEALASVHRAALRAAVERAELAGGIAGVFVNLARRSQILVHRQLSLLDSMERRSDDPNELSDLFRLDHLTTRMRRHAESLIILSGAAPGRAWRMPVPLTDVVRAAVSEVEDYARVEVRQLPEASVTGAAVADVTHLLAEIIENAAQFSPPHTRVRVTGEPVGNGYAIEVEDRGLGMGKDALAEANHRITRSGTLDLFDSDRLGLFVVSRLAARQDIKVHLGTSPYGGTTAVVLLPTALLHSETGAAPAREAHQAAGDEEHPYARVPGSAGQQDPVPAPVDRPALASAVPVATHTTTAGRPPGAPALRLHRSSDVPDASEAAARSDDSPESQPTGESDDLPRRVRQASLAPQLRDGSPVGPSRPGPPRGDEERTPEAVRDRMTAYRDGWSRGGGRRPGRPAPPEPPTGDSTEGDPA
ncbi:nitrate- and nitrite sensing domain-containing protein [Streptomyces sp. RS2]|uniref:sensor histidine kinase n=1 Tax=Streptomyces sp. RS2 TaxID=1451205 RepID=UPI0021F8E460|nr:nitrate- and nitrite sensing domain-containing protein [Streptomyces sp. RS2]MCW1092570.1 nitrate- and nitrite sensing domain-containing protein [Streptomyces sp. RS2]